MKQETYKIRLYDATINRISQMQKKQLYFSLVIVIWLTLITGCASKIPATTEGFGVKGDKWIVPRKDDHMPVWGIKEGIVVGIYPARLSFADYFGGPRGLLRIGFEYNGVLRFINFMAVTTLEESGSRIIGQGSEMTDSPSDNKQGIQFFAYPVDYLDHPERYKTTPDHQLAASVRTRNGSKVLEWGIKTERFPDGQEIFIILRIDEKRFNEVEFESYVLKGKSKVDSLVLTSTFGNITRLRKVFLKGGVVNAKDIYPGDYGSRFSDLKYFSLSKIPHDKNGDLIFACAPDEKEPWKIKPYAHGAKLIQYYRKTAGTWDGDFRASVNARTKYWKSTQNIPGGVSFENMAIVEKYRKGQKFSYGFYRGSMERLLDGRPPKRR